MGRQSQWDWAVLIPAILPPLDWFVHLPVALLHFFERACFVFIIWLEWIKGEMILIVKCKQWVYVKFCVCICAVEKCSPGRQLDAAGGVCAGCGWGSPELWASWPAHGQHTGAIHTSHHGDRDLEQHPHLHWHTGHPCQHHWLHTLTTH